MVMTYTAYLYSQSKGDYTKTFDNFNDYYVFLNKVAHSNYVEIVAMPYFNQEQKYYIDKIVWYLKYTNKWE